MRHITCARCGGPIRMGQFAVVLLSFMRGMNAYGEEEDVPLDMEDGSQRIHAHLGCVAKVEPRLVGITWGEPRDV